MPACPPPAPVLECGLVACPPDWRVDEPQGAPFCRIYHVTGGSVTYRDAVGGSRLPVGSLCLFPTHVPYTLRQDPAHPLHCLWFHRDLFPLALRRFLAVPVPDRGLLRSLLDALAEGVRANRDPRILLHLLEALVLEVRTQAPDALVSVSDRGVLAAAAHLQDHLDTPLSNGDLARLAGYHPDHLARLFRNRLGTTPHRYHLQLRLRQAAHLLSEGATLAETAARCGFGDAKAFGRAFLRQYGLPPSRYRRERRSLP